EPAADSSSCRKPATGASSVSSWTTPPAPLPQSAEAGPRITSTRPSEARSRWFSVVWPSGMVAGIPSTTTLTPRMPNCARAPKPRIESRSPSASLYRLSTCTPATPRNASSSPCPGRALGRITPQRVHGERRLVHAHRRAQHRDRQRHQRDHYQAVGCLLLGGEVGRGKGGGDDENRQRTRPNDLHTRLPRFLRIDGGPRTCVRTRWSKYIWRHSGQAERRPKSSRPAGAAHHHTGGFNARSGVKRGRAAAPHRWPQRPAGLLQPVPQPDGRPPREAGRDERLDARRVDVVEVVQREHAERVVLHVEHVLDVREDRHAVEQPVLGAEV